MASGEARFRFRLFIAGDTPNSAEALVNLRSLCDERLAERHEIEVVDVLREPQRALAEGIFLTPTLVKFEPRPLRRIVGTLRNTESVLLALDLDVAPA